LRATELYKYMVAVIYSGSNYADWRLSLKGRTVASFKTSSINPFFNDEKHILQLLNKNINLIHHAEEIKRIYFFGAGVLNQALKDVVSNSFSAFFKYAKITVEHDMAGAAIACCKNQPGIICICGSGSNAAWFDGKKVKPNNYGLGYILADEGSGNWLGKQLIKAYLNQTLPDTLRKKFVKRYDADRKILLEKVYHQRQPAIYLSSLAEFYIDNQDHTYLQEIITAGFEQMIKTYVLPLKQQYPDSEIHFTGSVAAGFKPYLHLAAEKAGVQIAYILKEPINNLLTYYSNKN
jgi:glucosamine kinase